MLDVLACVFRICSMIHDHNRDKIYPPLTPGVPDLVNGYQCTSTDVIDCGSGYKIDNVLRGGLLPHRT